jgi:integrase
MNLNDIALFLEKYGVKAPIITILIFTLLILLKTQWFEKYIIKYTDIFIKKFFTKKKGNEVRNITESDISNHDIFNYIDYWKYSKVPTLNYSTEYRTVVFRKYLSLYLKSYKENIFKYIDSKEYQGMDNARLSTSFISLINHIVFDYERESELNGIPSIIIEKMKFKNNETISLILDLIEGVCGSEFYSSEDNLLKVYSILNILLSVLENTISSSENICNSINGALEGLSFTDNGRIITERKKSNN